MSFHRARKGIRAVALVAVLVVAGLTLSSYLALKKRRAAERPALPAKMAEGVDQQTQAFTLSKSLGGQRLYTITASQMTNFKDTGKTLLKDVSIQLFGKNGTRQDRITAKECEFDPAAGTLFIPGDVDMDLQSPDDLQPGEVSPEVKDRVPDTGPVRIRTSGLSFNQNTGVASTDNAVRFRFKMGEGSSEGAVYNPGDRTVTLIAKARFDLRRLPGDMTGPAALAVAPEAANDARRKLAQGVAPQSSSESQSSSMPETEEVTHIAAGSLRLDSIAHKVFLTAPVRIEQGTRRIDAGDSEIPLDEEQHATGAVLRGGVHAVDSDLTALSEIVAASANVEFTPEGRIQRLDLASAEAPVRWAAASGLSIKSGESANVEMNFGPATAQLSRVNAWGKVRFSMAYLPAPASLPLLSAKTLPNGAKTLLTERADMKLALGGSSIEDLKTEGPSTIELAAAKPGDDKRTIRGDRLQFTFDAGELSEFAADGKVSVAAEGSILAAGAGARARNRMSTSDNLWAGFDQRTHNVSKMRQWGSFYYQDPDRKARSEKAEYEAGEERIALEGNVRVWNAEGTLTARSALLDTASGDMKAEGGVSTDYVGNYAGNYVASDTSPRAPGAPAQPPVNVTADRLDYNTRTQRALYQSLAGGRARLWQGTNVIQAETIEIDRKSSRLEARKSVYSVFGVPSRESQPKVLNKAATVSNPLMAATGENSGPVEVRAEELTYEDGKNSAVYRGKVRMKNATASLTCEELTIEFQPRAATSKQSNLQIEKAVATGNVLIVQPGREAKAERAEYLPDEKKVTLTGNLAAISDSEKGSTQGIRLTYFTGDDRISVDGKPGTQAETRRTVHP